MKKIILPLLLCVPLMAGCADGSFGPKQGFGTLGGAALGGWAGSAIGGGTGQLVGVAAGTLLGAFLGSEVGASLDRADQAYAVGAARTAYTAPIGQQIRWDNPQSGNYGVITPVREGRSQSGAYCREFSQTIYVGGRAQAATGRACLQPDGTWKIVN